MAGKREVWLDYVKVFACVLVVLGHFWQSMVKSGILPDGFAYGWFEQSVYTFHVPLFFICSGYLYQRYSRVKDAESWFASVTKKLVVLGVPYLFFTVLTLVMKSAGGDAVNQAAGGAVGTILFHPTASYWYLYVLFFMFVIVPTFADRRGLRNALLLALALKVLQLLNAQLGFLDLPWVVYKLAENLVWFIGGMFLTEGERPIDRGLSLAVGAAFLVASAAVYAADVGNQFVLFALGAAACVASVGLIRGSSPSGAIGRALDLAARYTMPVYLMHTIFAAGLRIALLKMRITGGVSPCCTGAHC